MPFTFPSAKDCGHLRTPVNGSSFGNLSTFPNKISFQCDDGFILMGSEMRQCQATGLWTGNETICEGKSKKLTRVPANAARKAQHVYCLYFSRIPAGNKRSKLL